jgi:DNA processing protein
MIAAVGPWRRRPGAGRRRGGERRAGDGGPRAVDRVDDDLAAAEPAAPASSPPKTRPGRTGVHGRGDAATATAAVRGRHGRCPRPASAAPARRRSLWSRHVELATGAPGERAGGRSARERRGWRRRGDAACSRRRVARDDGAARGGTLTDGRVGPMTAQERWGGPAQPIGAGARPARAICAADRAVGPRVGRARRTLRAGRRDRRGPAATGYGLHVRGSSAPGCAVGFTVVSGPRSGRRRGHRGALAAGGASVAVLAVRHRPQLPAAHEALLERIAATGLVVSEYPPGQCPRVHRFLVRNRSSRACRRAPSWWKPGCAAAPSAPRPTPVPGPPGDGRPRPGHLRSSAAATG